MSSKDWDPNLTPEQNYVLRQEGTESPGSSPLNNEKREGSYHCVGCGTKFLKKKLICTLVTQEQNIIVKNVEVTMDTCSMTGQNQQENAIATTACV
jgi:hypothetical protein